MSLMILEKEQASLLVLLDFFAAFDTIDYTILLGLLENFLGIKDIALSWIKSYLSKRTWIAELQSYYKNGIVSLHFKSNSF